MTSHKPQSIVNKQISGNENRKGVVAVIQRGVGVGVIGDEIDIIIL